jgi:UDP-N-acetylmuramyl pentapeptide phosphotransferase/UDP-N-acetylglucosamine-1-phosphate transferase
MGDAGSIPLGFLAAALGLLGWRDGLWQLWFPPVAFAPFIVDASATLALRALRGEELWRAHRSHYYQRLVLTGWSHRRLAVAEYGLMLVSGGAALLASHESGAPQVLILAALAVLYVLTGLTVDRRWRGRTQPH